MVLHTIARGFALKRGVKSLDVGKGFDLIAGTSTGGILGCCLAAGLSTRDTVNLYREVGLKIFVNPMPDTKVFFVKWVVNNLKHAANTSDQLREALTKKLGDMTLESLVRAEKDCSLYTVRKYGNQQKLGIQDTSQSRVGPGQEVQAGRCLSGHQCGSNLSAISSR